MSVLSSKMMLIIEKFGSLDDRIAFTPASPCNCTDSGYVTCSSMSCGLRPIQSAKTITWFSDKSGMASTGVRSSAHTPQIATPAQTRITSQRFRTENSMILEIMIFFHHGEHGEHRRRINSFLRALRGLRGEPKLD